VHRSGRVPPERIKTFKYLVRLPLDAFIASGRRYQRLCVADDVNVAMPAEDGSGVPREAQGPTRAEARPSWQVSQRL
jgi:hypothetical protein